MVELPPVRLLHVEGDGVATWVAHIDSQSLASTGDRDIVGIVAVAECGFRLPIRRGHLAEVAVNAHVALALTGRINGPLVVQADDRAVRDATRHDEGDHLVHSVAEPVELADEDLGST